MAPELSGPGHGSDRRSGHDAVMDRVIDLDQAAAQIARRVPVWSSWGLRPGAVTWRDGAASWPQRVETDRSRIENPDSVGIRIEHTGDLFPALGVVLYRGGWADVDALTTDGTVVAECPHPATADEFGAVLDGLVTRLFACGARETL